MAIQQGTVTITGFVGSMPVPFGRSGGVEGCSFRMGSTRRYRDGGTGEWRNLPTTWITVKAFRTLASNARMSLHVGEAAIVTGVLSTEEWTTQNDERRSRIVVEATNIGHDINYGVSELKKFQKEMLAWIDQKHPQIGEEIEELHSLSDTLISKIVDAVKEYKSQVVK